MINLIQALISNRIFRIICKLQFVLALAIFTYMALTPAPQLATQYSDRTLHFIGNVLLFLSAYVATAGRFRLALLVIFLVPYSAAIELSQYFTLSRQVDWRDLIANFLGLFAGYSAALLTAIVWRNATAPIATNPP